MSNTEFSKNYNTIHADNPQYKLELYEDILRDKDISSITLSEIPEELESVQLHIGGSKFFEFKNITENVNILPINIPTSKSYYLRTHLVFVYKPIECHSPENIISEDVLDYGEPEYSDTEEEFFDGHDYHWGRRVKRETILKTVKKLQVVVPAVSITTVSGADGKEEIPVWQEITLDPKSDEEYIRRLEAKHELQTLDGRTIDEAIAGGEPFHCKVKNVASFNKGMAGLMYCFR